MTDEIRKIDERADEISSDTASAIDAASAAENESAAPEQSSAPGKASIMDKPNLKYFGRLALTLLIITASVALMLGAVNALTAGRIAQLAEDKRLAAMEEVMPEGFEAEGESWSNENATVTQMKNGDEVAWCVNVSPKGFGGEIAMTVAVLRDPDDTLRVRKVAVMSHAETMGDPKNEEFLSQYSGLTNGVTLGGGENGIDAMTGATVSSKAITLGVNNALDAVQEALALGVFDADADEGGTNN